MPDVEPTSTLTGRPTTALYRTRITQLHRSPVHHHTERCSYSWYVDIDDLPRLPRWLQPFARFEGADHFHGAPDDTLRQRVDAVLADHGVHLPGGRVTALLLPRVLGRTCNPLSLFWCHDDQGVLRCVLAEMQHGGRRHAYLLPPGEYASPFGGSGGQYVIRAPLPDEEVDLRMSLFRDHDAAVIATVRGTRRPATVAQILRMQVTVPLAPQMTALSMRVHDFVLRLRGVPALPRPAEQLERSPHTVAIRPGWAAQKCSWMPS
ncbi:DUF1365 family protein [Mycolicibacterium aichiense]|uniref:DUF1365 family protein n=1 Tax=Mycolicibacterium aichiense TaxID=1799 RepID=UPI003976E2B5